jgi:F0F1-type ATP synthase delta subunit
MTIEHVSVSDFAQIQCSRECHLQRKVKLETAKNIGLIAGFWIYVGDYVWERPIRGDLSRLCYESLSFYF